MAILPLAFLTPGLHNGRSNAKEAGMTDNGEEALRERLAGLRLAHGDLDSAISSLELRGVADQLQLTRLKKRKLMFKDEISEIEDLLLPDIIA